MLDPGWCGRVLEGPAPSKYESSAKAFGGAGVAGVYDGHGLKQGLKGPNLLEGEDVNLQGEEGEYNEVHMGGDTPKVPG